MPSLYPTISLPTLVAPPTTPSERKYLPAPFFDLESGDFLFDSAGRFIFADGKEAFEQWCVKVCATERGTRLAYSDKVGTEFEAAMHMSDPEAVKSSIIRTITESIMVHPAAEYVKDFQFRMSGDNLYVTFTVKGKPWAEASQLTVRG